MRTLHVFNGLYYKSQSIVILRIWHHEPIEKGYWVILPHTLAETGFLSELHSVAEINS